ncbi:MAG: type II toxin-antitoxin system HigB family toxin [Saprospiraceae bacterium]|nr:type II toxin-antitoxin system HigB family toxin [Saprospiraceae bacterium]
MKITNRVLIHAFIKKHGSALNAVNRWIEIIQNSDISSHNDLKAYFPQSDYVGNNR